MYGAAFWVLFVVVLMYGHFYELVESILLLTDAPEEVRAIFDDHWSSFSSWLYLSSVLYFLLTIAASVYYTHKFVGPSVAFQKHLEEIAKGNFKHLTHLRKGDQLEGVADALNKVSEVLSKN